jgi:hypothetical protein
MKQRHDEKWIAIRRLRRRGLPLALIAGSLVLLQASECKKGRGFYVPVGLTGDVTDNNPPVFILLPVQNTILNDVMIMATITDPSGVVGETVSATGNDGADLAISSAGVNMYNADISNWGDGLRMVEWSAFDEAGNEGMETQTLTIDRTDPDVSFTQMPDPTGMSDQATADLTYTFTITELHLASATFGVFNCNTGAAWPEGTDGGQVEDQSQTFTTTGSHTATFRFHNGNTGTSDIVAPYCFNGTALDAAVTKTQQPAANSFDFSGRVDFTWKPMAGGGDFTVGLNDPLPGWLHDMPGVSSLECKVIQTSPAQPGATFSATATGPTEGGPSGVLTPQPVTGTLDANGRAELQVRINRIGTYQNTVTVTVGGVTRMATQTITVLPTPNTCPLLPSSIRFKRGVMGLLPDDVRPLGLRPVVFRYREPWGDPAEPQIGLIAEEVIEVFPEAVFLDAEGRPQAIDYGTLTGVVLEDVVERAGRAAASGVASLARWF